MPFSLPWLPRRWRRPRDLPADTWPQTVQALPFLRELSPQELRRLQTLVRHFLLEKEFQGAHGLQVSDAMALSVAAQACLPLLHMRPPSGQRDKDGLKVLDWYGDFVGIVIQPGAAIAPRKRHGPDGVVHQYAEVLAGEAMDKGPVMFSWEDIARAADAAEQGSNLVIHEFAHKIDMRGMPAGGTPDGAPLLHAGLWGTSSTRQASEHWRTTMLSAYQRHKEALSLAERFGGPVPWLDDYAATDPAEFFAVTCEAYFVARARFGQEHPELLVLFDGFFRPDQAPASTLTA